MPLKSALHIRPESILFATDLSFESERAMRHAAALARHYRAKLHMVHVVSSMGVKLAGPEALAMATVANRRDLDNLTRKLAAEGRLEGVVHDALVCSGEIWPQLERLLDEYSADVIVIGTHGRRGLGRLLLGSVAEEIIRRADCPVLTVGPDFSVSGVENTRAPRPVLLATDFQPASLRALPYVATFAKERRVPLILLYVVPLLPESGESDWRRSDSLQERREQAEALALEKLKALMHRHAIDEGQVECVVRCGEPAEEILKFAREFPLDVIAMGLHRSVYPEAVTHFRKTVAHQVISRARCAVLTVRS